MLLYRRPWLDALSSVAVFIATLRRASVAFLLQATKLHEANIKPARKGHTYNHKAGRLFIYYTAE